MTVFTPEYWVGVLGWCFGLVFRREVGVMVEVGTAVRMQSANIGNQTPPEVGVGGERRLVRSQARLGIGDRSVDTVAHEKQLSEGLVGEGALSDRQVKVEILSGRDIFGEPMQPGMAAKRVGRARRFSQRISNFFWSPFRKLGQKIGAANLGRKRRKRNAGTGGMQDAQPVPISDPISDPVSISDPVPLRRGKAAEYGIMLPTTRHLRFNKIYDERSEDKCLNSAEQERARNVVQALVLAARGRNGMSKLESNDIDGGDRYVVGRAVEQGLLDAEWGIGVEARVSKAKDIYRSVRPEDPNYAVSQYRLGCCFANLNDNENISKWLIGVSESRYLETLQCPLQCFEAAEAAGDPDARVLMDAFRQEGISAESMGRERPSLGSV